MSRLCHLWPALLVAVGSPGCYLSHERAERREPPEVDASPPSSDAGRDSSARDAIAPDAIAPDARRCEAEVCNGLDDDCDGALDEDVCTTLATHIAVSGGTSGELACASTRGGRVACWGGSGLVRGDPFGWGPINPLPRFVVGVSDALDVGVGAYARCALTTDGVMCWGQWASGVAEAMPAAPIAIPQLAGATSLTVAASSYCGIVDSEVVCSANSPGLGRPDPAAFWTVPAVGPAVSVSSSPWNAFIVQADGALFGWGLNYAGELGNGTIASRSDTPVPVTGVVDARAVCTGNRFTCAIRTGGRVACWGGLLGDGTSGSSAVPVDTSIENAVQVSCGSNHACAVLDDGSAWCWGRNHEAQLGDGTEEPGLSPVRVALDEVAEISAGAQTTCAVRVDGTVWCWGNNCHGAIGDGTTDGERRGDGTCTRVRRVPTRALLP